MKTAEQTLKTAPCIALAQDELAIEQRRSYLCEIDSLDSPEAVSLHAELEEIRTEIARRIENGIHIEDPHALSFEERYAPFGPAWQEEQEGRW